MNNAALGTFDFIIMNHSLEHMPDQSEIFLVINKILKKGGSCLIRIPVVGYAWDTYGIDWYQLDVPRHYFIHTQKSIECLAQKSGLKVEKIIYDSTEEQFICSEYYSKGVPLKDQKYSRWEFIKYRQKSKGLNKQCLGDQAGFLLRK